MTGYDIVRAARNILDEGCGYIWGTSGEVWTAAKQAAATREMTVKYGAKWIGRRVYDCAGLVKAILRDAGISFPGGTNSQWKGDYWKEKGTLSADQLAALPPGALLYKYNSSDGYYHVGIYEGDGSVIEARGTQSGVIRSDAKGWTHYGLLKMIDYSSEVKNPMEAGSTAIVDVPNDGTVNVRSKPSTKGTKITTLPEGAEVEVLAESGGWAKVRYTSEGYIMSQYLKGVEG